MGNEAPKKLISINMFFDEFDGMLYNSLSSIPARSRARYLRTLALERLLVMRREEGSECSSKTPPKETEK